MIAAPCSAAFSFLGKLGHGIEYVLCEKVVNIVENQIYQFDFYCPHHQFFLFLVVQLHHTISSSYRPRFGCVAVVKRKSNANAERNYIHL